MATFIGTFPRTSTLRPHYVRIEAHSELSAREIMAIWYGLHWEQVYSEVYVPTLERCGLTEVEFGTLQVEVS